MVHETGRAAVSKLHSLTLGRNIFSAVFSNADINWNVSPQRKDNLVFRAQNEISKSGLCSFYPLSLFLARNVTNLQLFLEPKCNCRAGVYGGFTTLERQTEPRAGDGSHGLLAVSVVKTQIR